MHDDEIETDVARVPRALCAARASRLRARQVARDERRHADSGSRAMSAATPRLGRAR
jgi:hypothetical protein